MDETEIEEKLTRAARDVTKSAPHKTDEEVMDEHDIEYDEARDVRYKAALFEAEKLEGGSGKMTDSAKVYGDDGINEMLNSWEETDRDDNVKRPTGLEANRGVKDLFNYDQSKKLI